MSSSSFSFSSLISSSIFSGVCFFSSPFGGSQEVPFHYPEPEPEPEKLKVAFSGSLELNVESYGDTHEGWLSY